MLKLSERGQPVDYLSVDEMLKAKGETDLGAWVSGLTDEVPTASNVDYYARLVRKAAQRRRLHGAMGELMVRLEGGADPVEVSGEACQLALEDGAEEFGKDVYSMAEALEVAVQEITDIKDRVVAGSVPMGFPSLEKYEPRPGYVVVIGAHPSVGKSELAVEIGMNIAALPRPVPNLFISSEMSLTDCLFRALSRSSMVSPDVFKSDRPFTNDESLRLGKACRDLKPLPMHWSLRNELGRIVALVRREVKAKKIGAVFVDYLQLLRLPDGDNRNLQVQHASRVFKELARETGTVVYLLSQVNRQTSRDGNAPSMRDLRDSGSIEQDADVVIMLHREKGGDILHLNVEKNRNGRIGQARMHFSEGRIFDDIAE
jgi:replicative DNA helicase